MKKFHKAVTEYKYFKFKFNMENTFLVYFEDKNEFYVFINWSKDYLTNNCHFINIY
jgi:hypothetical protein